MFQFQNAKLLIPLRLSDLFEASYPRKIIFGCYEESNFSFKKSIIVDLENIQKFYQNIIELISAFQNDPVTPTEPKRFAFYDNYDYSWQISLAGNICFIVSCKDEILSKFSFQFEQFNELLFVFTQCILPSLCLSNEELDFLTLASKSKFLSLIELKNSSEIETFISELNPKYKKEYFKYKILILYHLDIILIINKLNEFCNVELLPNQIESLIQ